MTGEVTPQPAHPTEDAGAGAAQSDAANAMSRANVEAMAALSAMQEGILFHAMLGEQQGAYVNQHLIHLQGEVDTVHLHEAWLEICRRHQVLRASFVWERVAKPVQVFWHHAAVSFDEVDLREVTPEVQDERIRAFLREDKRRGFDLTVPPLMRLTLFRLSLDRHVLYWCNHHLILDGWSAAIVAREVFTLYAARQRGVSAHLPEPTPFLNYLRWLKRQDVRQAEAFWRATLEDAIPTLLWESGVKASPPGGRALTGKNQDANAPGTFEQVEVRLSAEETVELAACCRRLGVTQSVFCQAAWGSLLSLYTGSSDVVFGVTSSGRPTELEGIESMVGLFIATLPLRLHISPEWTLTDLLLDTQDRGMAIRGYEFTPLAQVLGWAGTAVASPLFDTLMVFENYPVDDVLQTGAAGLRITGIEVKEATNYPLTLTIGPGREMKFQFTGLAGTVPQTELYNIAHRFRQHLLTLLRAPNASLGSLAWLVPSELDNVRALGTGPVEDFGAGFVQDRIAAQARATPEHPALTFEGETLTYTQLIARADALATWLATKGIGPEQICGVLAERGIGMAVALLAILRAGGCYLPLDPENPQERLATYLKRSKPRLVLAERRCAGAILHGETPVFCLEDALAESDASMPFEPRDPVPLAQGSSAYCIFTSGSTGEPKAVVNTHAGLWNRLQWMQQRFPIGEADTVLQKTPFAFDVSVWEFFWPWMTGARLLLARPGGHRDGAYLHELIDHERVTTLHFVPSMLDLFLEQPGQKQHDSLRQVFCSGEALTPELMERFFVRCQCPLYNLYGPTEAAIDVTWWPCDPAGRQTRIPIGKPIANMQAHVLDAEMRPVPDGLRGELFLGGVGLARGYLGRADLTAERFPPHPFGKNGARLYRTGDIVRRRPDGVIEYVGRSDGQVKLRGLRIELGEIESALRRVEGITQAIVRVQTGRAGQQELVAYAGGSQRDVVAVRAKLAVGLPAYMVPAKFVMLDRLPVNRNGKLDTLALAALETEKSAAPKLPPRGEKEERIARLWQEVLQAGELGRDDDFREVGGSSLLAIRLLSRLRVEFNQELPLSLIFEQPTIAALAQAIPVSGTSAPSAPVQRRKTTEAPLSFAQQRQWFLAQWSGGNQAYNLPLLLQVRGALDHQRVHAALQQLCDRHETLHSRIVSRDNKLLMEPVSSCRVELEYREASEGAEELVREWVKRPFDLTHAPWMRSCLIGRGETNYWLLLVFHHIAVDGYSLQLLSHEFLRLYEGETLAPLSVHYGDVAAWEQEQAKEARFRDAEQFWRQHLASREPPLALPVDVSSSLPPGSGASFQSALSQGALQTMRELARELHMSEAAVTAAALGLLLGRWSRMKRFLIGMPIAQRDLPGTEDMVGLLLNTLPLRVDLASGTVADLLAQMQVELHQLMTHGHYPLERILGAVRPERDAAGHSLFRVLLVTQFEDRNTVHSGETQWKALPVPAQSSKFDLTLSTSLSTDRSAFTWEYRTDLFRPETIAALAQALDTLLARLRSDLQTSLENIPIALPRVSDQSRTTISDAPAPSEPDTDESETAAARDLERALTKLWTEVLNVPSVDRHDNFFSIGGDSLLSIRICNRATEEGIPLEVSDLFQAQTIAALARRVAGKTVPPAPVSVSPSELALPLSPSQAFFFRMLDEDAHHFNLARLVTTPVRLSEDRWREIAGALAERHDALRLRFGGKGADRYAVLDPFCMDRHASFKRVDLSDASGDEASAAIERESIRFQESFNLERGSLFRLVWFDLGAHRPGRLLLLVHHLVADGFSLSLLMRDLEQLILRAQAVQTIALPPLRMAWGAWVQRLAAFATTSQAKEQALPWLTSRPGLSLPLDFHGAPNLQEDEAEIIVTVPRPATRIPAHLMKALGATLQEWIGTNQYQYDWISNGRFPFQSEVDVSQTSGYFSTRLPVLGEWASEPSFWLRSNPLAYGVGRFLMTSDDLTESLLAFERSSLSLNYLGDVTAVQAGADLFSPAMERTGPDRSPRQQRACALRLFALSTADDLRITWKYSPRLHRESTVRRWAQRMAALLLQPEEQ